MCVCVRATCVGLCYFPARSLSLSLVLSFVRVYAVVYCRSKRRDEKTFIVKVYARIFLFLRFHSTHANNGFLVSFAYETAAMSMCHLTHSTTFECHWYATRVQFTVCSLSHSMPTLFFCFALPFFNRLCSHSILLHIHEMRSKREHVANKS